MLTADNALSRLRVITGDVLFVRHARGLKPTPRGRQLAHSARRIQAFLREELGQGQRFEPRTLRRSFTLCMSDVGQRVFLPRLLSHIRAEAPNVDIVTVSLPPRRLTERLEEGSVDLAVGYFPDLTGAGLDQQFLFARDFLCLAARDHPRIDASTWSQAAFLVEPHLVVSPEGRVEELFERSLRDRGLSRRVVLSVPHAFAMGAVIASSDLVATVSRSVGDVLGREPELRALPLPLPSPRIRIAQHWSARFARDPAGLWLRDLVAVVGSGDTDPDRG